MSRRAPSASARATVSAALATPTTPSQCGGAPIAFASSGSTATPPMAPEGEDRTV